jgi:hypothetical protein
MMANSVLYLLSGLTLVTNAVAFEMAIGASSLILKRFGRMYPVVFWTTHATVFLVYVCGVRLIMDGLTM